MTAILDPVTRSEPNIDLIYGLSRARPKPAFFSFSPFPLFFFFFRTEESLKAKGLACLTPDNPLLSARHPVAHPLLLARFRSLFSFLFCLSLSLSPTRDENSVYINDNKRPAAASAGRCANSHGKLNAYRGSTRPSHGASVCPAETDFSFAHLARDVPHPATILRGGVITRPSGLAP